MWKNNVSVLRVYATHGTQVVYAIFSGVTGWQRVKPGSPDGVSNITELLSAAKAHGRNVNVFLQGTQIERALML